MLDNGLGEIAVMIVGTLRFSSSSPGLNFINALRTAFTHLDPKSIKKTVKLSIFITLLGSMGIKAARKTLVKLTPDVSL